MVKKSEYGVTNDFPHEVLSKFSPPPKSYLVPIEDEID